VTSDRREEKGKSTRSTMGSLPSPHAGEKEKLPLRHRKKDK